MHTFPLESLLHVDVDTGRYHSAQEASVGHKADLLLELVVVQHGVFHFSIIISLQNVTFY